MWEVQINKNIGHTVMVLDAFMVGQWLDNKLATSVFVTLGSVVQKATFLKLMAGWDKISCISCGDAFPKRGMAEAKRLNQKGLALRKNSQVASKGACLHARAQNVGQAGKQWKGQMGNLQDAGGECTARAAWRQHG